MNESPLKSKSLYHEVRRDHKDEELNSTSEWDRELTELSPSILDLLPVTIKGAEDEVAAIAATAGVSTQDLRDFAAGSSEWNGED
jgi:hypothetical protein